MKIIVTAGGQGKKIWPLSRVDKPKQFQAVVGDTSLYQQTIETLLKAFSAEDIYISTKQKYQKSIKEQSPQLDDNNMIFEPDLAKGRGPGEGIVFATLAEKHPNEPFIIVQADQLKTPEEDFLRTLVASEKVQIKHKKFMSGGVKATFPVLGVDYLRFSERVSVEDGVEFFKIEEFIPRNDNYYQTKKLIENFHVGTHINHNCWYPEMMMDSYKQYRPDWHQGVTKIAKMILEKKSQTEVDEEYSKMEAGDTEVITNNLFKDGLAILMPCRCIDFGSWDSVYEFLGTSGDVITDGNVITIDAESSLVKSSVKNKIIAVAGIQNLVIIDTEDALLVIPRDKSGLVADLVNKIKEKGQKNYL